MEHLLVLLDKLVEKRLRMHLADNCLRDVLVGEEYSVTQDNEVKDRTIKPVDGKKIHAG